MYSNPYFGTNVGSFFLVLLQRLWALLSGDLAWTDLAADEVQILVLSGVAASSAIVGVFLVLKKMTMLANALSHTILLGIVIAFLITHGMLGAEESAQVHGLGHLNLSALLLSAVATGLVTAFLTQFLTSSIGLQEDASTGLVFTTLFSIGVILVTVFTRNAHIGTELIMGNADALQLGDGKLVLITVLLNAALVLLFYKEFKITTFDGMLAQSLGFSTMFFNYLLMVQTSITSIAAFRAVGVIMVLAFMTGPPLTARLLTNNLGKVLALAVAIGIAAALIGVAIARHMLTVFNMPLSTGGITVCVIAAIFCATLALRHSNASEGAKPQQS